MSEGMNERPLGADESWLQRAVQNGWLPASLPSEQEEPSPWMIAVLMVLLGVCAASAMGLLVVILDELLPPSRIAAYAVGLLIWGAALPWLRAPKGLLEACLSAVGVLTASLWLAAFSILQGDVSWMTGALLQALALMVCAALAKPRWLTALLSVLATLWLMLGLMRITDMSAGLLNGMWWLCVLLAVCWASWAWHEGRLLKHARAGHWAAMADGVCAGMMLGVLVLDVLFRGLAGVLDGVAVDRFTQLAAGVVSAAAVVCWHLRWRSATPSPALAASHAARDGTSASSTGLLVLGLGLVVCLGSVMQPWLAPVAVVAALAAATARWRWLIGTGAMALWLLSRFYYDLNWPLTSKAAALAAMGAVLLLVLGVRRGLQRSALAAQGPITGAVPTRVGEAGGVARSGRAAGVSILLGALACWGLLNADVMRKERVLSEGETLLVALQPVDPRSLMQGDYMDLRFDIPEAVLQDLNDLPAQALLRQTPVVVKLVQGRAHIVRLAKPDEALAADERRMPLKRLKSQWVLVTDAYFFPEGDGERFEQARWGEFRLLPDGRALLVGLSDAEGKAIASPNDLRNPFW